MLFLFLCPRANRSRRSLLCRSFQRPNRYFALSLSIHERFARKTKERIPNPDFFGPSVLNKQAVRYCLIHQQLIADCWIKNNFFLVYILVLIINMVPAGQHCKPHLQTYTSYLTSNVLKKKIGCKFFPSTFIDGVE